MVKCWVGVKLVKSKVECPFVYANGKVPVVKLMPKFQNWVEAFLLPMELKCYSTGCWPVVVSLSELVVASAKNFLKESKMLVVRGPKLVVLTSQLLDPTECLKIG